MASIFTRRLVVKSLRIKEFSTFTTCQMYTGTFCSSNRFRTISQTNLIHPKLRSCMGVSPSLKLYSTQKEKGSELDEKESEKLTLFQRFKKMYRDYWYVLVPVHLVTSTIWFGSFYYLAKSGVDISALLESLNVSEKITKSLKDSSMGNIAVAYAMYKITTPVRYTVTLGGTTLSINYLTRWGYIKPVPSKDRLKEMYNEKKENFIESVRDTQNIYKEKKDTIIDKYKDKKENFIDTVRDKKEQIKMQSKKIIDDKNIKKN